MVDGNDLLKPSLDNGHYFCIIYKYIVTNEKKWLNNDNVLKAIQNNPVLGANH